MKKVLALVVAAAMGLSSVAFAAEAATTTAPAATATTATAAPAKAQVKHHGKKAPVQKAQAAKKHHKKAGKKAPAQKAQAAKKHHKKASHKTAYCREVPLTASGLTCTTPGSPGVFSSGGFSLMLRRYLFEIILTALILCGLIAVFFYL